MRSTAEIDKEWLRIKPTIAKIKGDKCFYCGSPAEEYHHIIPRHMGGDNRLENIVPMCAECHKKAHSKRPYKRQAQWGRSRIEAPANFTGIARQYLDSEITFNKALELTGLKKNTFYRLLEEYRKETGDNRRHRNLGNRHRRSKDGNKFKSKGC
jgi:hypothetical protein